MITENNCKNFVKAKHPNINKVLSENKDDYFYLSLIFQVEMLQTQNEPPIKRVLSGKIKIEP